MKKLSIIAVGAVLAVAVVATVPATLGLIGNASFAESVPVPSQAVVVDDKGGLTKHVELGDDAGAHRSTGTVEPGDDKGGLTKHVEPGDDKGGLTKHVETGNDKVADNGSGKDDNGEHGVVDSDKDGKDDGSGHS
jgi:hypothetical protein